MPRISFIGSKIDKKIEVSDCIKRSFAADKQWVVGGRADDSYTLSIGVSGIKNPDEYQYGTKENSAIMMPSPYSPSKTTRLMLNSADYNKCKQHSVDKSKLPKHIRMGYLDAPATEWTLRDGPVLVLLPACPGPWKHKSVAGTVEEYLHLVKNIRAHSDGKILFRFHPRSGDRFKHSLKHRLAGIAEEGNRDVAVLVRTVGKVVSNWGTFGAFFAMRGIPVFNLSDNGTVTNPVSIKTFSDLGNRELRFPMSPWEYGEWVASHVFSIDDIKSGEVPRFVAANSGAG